jgi:hypothetical protein
MELGSVTLKRLEGGPTTFNNSFIIHFSFPSSPLTSLSLSLSRSLSLDGLGDFGTGRTPSPCAAWDERVGIHAAHAYQSLVPRRVEIALQKLLTVFCWYVV